MLSQHLLYLRRTLTSDAPSHSCTIVPQEESGDKISKAACGDLSNNEKEDDEEMEQEEMFVDAHESFEYQTREWGGPRRGGRLPEPTRFGDWERKGRCTDF